MAKKIFFLEDDEFLGHSAKFALERDGFEVLIEKDGERALERIREFKPHLILLDVMVPNKGGVEVLEEIRADEGLQSVPVLMLSNFFTEEVTEKTKALGALEYLVKSELSLKDVVEKVRTYIDA